ncbi:MAG: CHAT domain-containing protein [Bryobacteraceae bacterium]
MIRGTCFAALVFVVPSIVVAQPPPVARAAGKLEIHKPIERELGRGQRDVFTVDVGAGQFSQVIARKKGVNLALSVLDPAGSTLLTSYSPNKSSRSLSPGEEINFNYSFGRETASWIAEVAGTYSVTVEQYLNDSGRYEIELTELGPPSNRDRARIQAEFKSRAAVTKEISGSLYVDSVPFYEEAASLWRALGEPYEEALCLHRIGFIYTHAAGGTPEKRLDYYKQALASYRAAGDRAGEAATLDFIAHQYFILRDMQKALEFYRQLQPVRRAVANPDAEADSLSGMGDVYAALGEPEMAREFYNQTLAIRRRRSDHKGETNALYKIGSLCDGVGDDRKALDFYTRSLASGRDANATLETLGVIEAIYYDLGDKRKALEYYKSTFERGILRNFRTLDWDWQSYYHATDLLAAGDVDAAIGEKQSALKNYNAALPLFREPPHPARRNELDTLAKIGQIYSDLGEKSRALDFYNQALASDAGGSTLMYVGVGYSRLGESSKAMELFTHALPIFRAGSDGRGEAAAFNQLSLLFRDQHALDAAIRFGKLAAGALLREKKNDRPGVSGYLIPGYEKPIEWTCRNLAGLLVEQQRLAEAEEVLNLLKDIESGAVQKKAPALLDFEKKSLERLDQLTAIGTNNELLQFVQQQGSQPSSARPAEEFPKLGRKVVAIYTLALPDKFIAMLVTGGSRKAYTTTITETDLNAKVFEFRQRLQNPNSDPLPLAKELYRIVFPEGLRRDLDRTGANAILWSIDGALRYIPIAALHDGKDYLVSSFSNSLITPTRLTRPVETPHAAWRGIGFGVSEPLFEFSRLSSVPDELHSIFRERETGGQPIVGVIRLNTDFTRETFTNDLKQPGNNVVHIASRFDFQRTASRSHLLFAHGSTLSEADLEASTNLFDGVDLLTLSASSASFTNGDGDGREAERFGKIAQRLGAKAVITSLWNVDNQATVRLMESMYRLRQQRPEIGASEALRRAQEKMRTGTIRDSRHPYYWSRFVITGD